MDNFDYWRLSDELSVAQAALLICGEDPSGEFQFVEDKATDLWPKGYAAAKNALIGWVLNEQVAGSIEYEMDSNFEGPDTPSNRIDIHATKIQVEPLRELLQNRGFRDGFFVRDDRKVRGYLDPEHECYAPKLAAAVSAWGAVSSNSTLLNGKTPKQAIEKWLREHANEYELSGEDGNPVAAAIEQISKVTNWKPQGGASKTPTPTQVKVNPLPDKKVDENQPLNENNTETSRS